MIRATLVLFTSCLVFGQSAAAPIFEVASVKPSPPGARYSAGGDSGRITYTSVPLPTLLMRAYGVLSYQISGPSWLERERYDIAAKAPDNTPAEQIALMLQALLAERFKLKVHRETKTLAVYALLAARNGAKLEKAEGSGQGMSFGNGRINGRNLTMADFASGLSGLMDRPVLDQTELPGPYNFTFPVNVPELAAIRQGGKTPPNNAGLPSIFEAVQQIGLRFESRKAPVEMIVIDSAERVPIEN